ncbi:MAG: hypothetical protein N3J91_11150, partial [Verrucomicrobiae bacterium]|nr:hypothetical protein [Verrucomicrobiae bacterium]
KEINAAHITNTALLAYLRYPITMWPLGAIQVINRVKYALIQKRYSGIIRGLIQIPLMCYKYRKYRNVVKHHTILESRKLLERGWKTNGD